MKKNISIYIVLILLLTSWSCNEDKFFEMDRPQETQWTNTTTFDQGLATAYFALNYRTRGIPQMMDFASSGVSQLLPGTSTGAAWNEMYNRLFNQNHSHTNDMWTNLYNAITISNFALELDQKNAGNPFKLLPSSTDYKDNYTRQIGEYYFVRAFSYYLLVRTFAPPYDHKGANTGAFIPLKTKVPTNRAEILEESLGSNEVVYNQIIADLLVAKEKLPGAFNSATMLPTYSAGRATKYSAAALLSKVYFVKGDYAKAMTESDFVITASETTKRYELEEPIQAFNKNTANNIPKETILEYNTGDPSVGNGEQTSSYMYWGWVISLQDRDADDFGRGAGMRKSGTNQFTLSYWAINKTGWMADPLKGDYTITEDAKQDLRFTQVYYPLLAYKAGADPFLYETLAVHSKVDKPQIYVDKYFRGGPGDGRYSKFPLIRLADIYLVRAWLRWKSGDNAGAAADLNKVWNRANPTRLNKFTSATVTHEAILAEYIKEMSGEGWTLDFMVGTQMDIPAGDRVNVAAIPPPYSVWKWVVPAAEKSLNPDYQ